MPFAKPKKRDPVGEPELFNYAVSTLARRPRTVRDLRRLLKLRAEPGDPGEAAINRVLARLTDLRYLSDEQFAADYTRLRKDGQSLGQRRVRQDLAAKGIAKDLAATTLANAYSDTDEVALAQQFCTRKRIQPPTTEKETARTLGRLLRAGFSSTSIWKLLRSWKVEINEETDLEPADADDSAT